MKNNIKYIVKKALLFLTPFLIWSCEDVISVDVQKSGVTQLVVDGFINNRPVSQNIKLSLTQPYFNNAAIKPALGATVYVTDDSGKRFDFKDTNNTGNYSYNSTFGEVGKTYTLYVKYDGEEYTSVSKMNRVPKIDSLVYEYKTSKEPAQQGIDGPDEGYLPEIYARDFEGAGDCYWFKGGRNNTYYSGISSTVIAYDASFDKGANIDGLIFIQPLRRAPFRQLFAEKDTVKAEIHSIPYEAFRFFQILQDQDQAQNAGLFATPVANYPTNIVNKNSSSTKKPLGFFCVSAVSLFQTVVDKNKARPSTN